MKMPHPIRALKRARKSLTEIKARHDTRHQATGFGFVLADSVDFLDGLRWDRLTENDSIWLRRDVLRVIEQAGPDNVTPRYAMIFRDGQPVAALAAQIVQVTGPQLPAAKAKSAGESKPSLVKQILRPAHKLASKKLNERMLVAGNLLCWGFHGIALAADEDEPALWSGIGEALYRIRRADRLTGQTNLVMIKDFTPAQSGMESLHRLSYRPMETEPDMILSLPAAWKTYDDYLAALESKYRSNVKSQQKKLAAGGVTIERLHDLTAEAGRLHQLYCEVQQNATIKLVTVPQTYLPALAQALGEDFRCHVARRGETIVGFITVLKDRSTAIAYYIGFDRAVASEGLPIYLRLLHATIADAIEWGCERLSLGRTALEPKAALGAKPEPLSVWLRHRVPALNWIIRSLLEAVPHDEPPERSPFKGSASQPSQT